VKEQIEVARQHDLLANSKALEVISEELETTNLSASARASLASRLEQVNQLANYVTRTRRRDVEEFRVERDPKAPTLDMAVDEDTFYNAVTQEVTEYARGCAANERFLLSTPQRLLTSSPAAASAYWAMYGG